MLEQDSELLAADCKKFTDTGYYCQPDPQVPGDKQINQSDSGYHRLQIDVKGVPRYGRVWPALGKPKQILHYEYRLKPTFAQEPDKVTPLMEEAD